MDRNDRLEVENKLDEAAVSIAEITKKTKLAREVMGWQQVGEQIMRAKYILGEMAK
jgi:hypothetical protein